MIKKYSNFNYDHSNKNLVNLLAIKARNKDAKSLELLEEKFYPYSMKVTSNFLKAYKIPICEPGDFILSFHEAMLKSINNFNEQKGDFKSFFLTIYVQIIHRRIEKEYLNNVLLFNAMSLDQVTNTDGGTLHDVIASENSDPRMLINENQGIRLFISDSHLPKHLQNEENRLQKHLILLRCCGLSIKELSDLYQIPVRVVRRIINDDGAGTSLGEFKRVHKDSLT